MPEATYTTLTRLQKRLSADGVSLRDDDDTTAYLQFIDDASDEVEFYCLDGYASTDLTTSGWVHKVCTDIAVYLYCWRRLNAVPDGVQKMFDFAIERLEQIARGSFKIPRLTPRKQSVPILRNIRPRMRPFPRPVVTMGNSTGNPQTYVQHADRLDWPDYTIAIMPFLALLSSLMVVA